MASPGACASSFTLRPPPQSLQVERVEYPGRILHVDRALATLGGSAELAKQFSKPSVVDSAKHACPAQLSLRLGHASSQPGDADAVRTSALASDSTASRGFLLCITLDESGSASDAVISASYQRSHSFHRLADFVYRRDEPSAASHIAVSGVINGAAPSIAQVVRNASSSFTFEVTPCSAAGGHGPFQHACTAAILPAGLSAGCPDTVPEAGGQPHRVRHQASDRVSICAAQVPQVQLLLYVYWCRYSFVSAKFVNVCSC
jgi:hypothetical protein